MRCKFAIFLLLPVLLCASAHPTLPNGRSRGHKSGDYSVTVAGHFAGNGTATVGTAISLSVTVTTSSGATGTLAATNLTITNGYFKGAGTILGVACTLQGRVDLPSAADADQTDSQAITGRITGAFKDAGGNVGRFVAVQSNPSPDTSGGDGDGD